MARLSAGIFALAILSICKDTAGVSLPAVTGKNAVGTVNVQLTDYSRNNSFASAPGPRSFVVQLFYPAKNAKTFPIAQYMGARTATVYEHTLSLPNGTISLIETNSHLGAPIASCDDPRVILFSTGFGVGRQIYTTFAEDLASHGYLVVAMDHTYDSPVVEFPDGSLVFSNPNTTLTDPAVLARFLDARIKDSLFTVNMLYKNLTQAIPGVRRSLRIRKTGMFGHSFGGATTANVLQLDPRVQGGLNMDGSVYGEAATIGFTEPWVFMGVPSHNLTSDDTWQSLWGNLDGWKRAIVLEGAAHLTYTDFAPLAAILELDKLLPAEELQSSIGTIDGLRANVIQRAYIKAFFDFVLKDKNATLFDGPNAKFPEITFQV